MEYRGLQINHVAFEEHIHRGDPLHQLMLHEKRGIDTQMTHLVAMQQFNAINGHFKLRVYNDRAVILHNGQTLNLTDAQPGHCHELVERVKKFRYEVPKPRLRPPPAQPKLKKRPAPPPFGQHLLKKTGRLGKEIGSTYIPPPNPLLKKIANTRAGFKHAAQNAAKSYKHKPTSPQADLSKTANGDRLKASIGSASNAKPTGENEEVKKAREGLRKTRKSLSKQDQTANRPASTNAPQSKAETEQARPFRIEFDDEGRPKLPRPNLDRVAEKMERQMMTDFELEKKIRAARFEINRLKGTPMSIALSQMTHTPIFSPVQASINQAKIENLNRELQELESEKQKRVLNQKQANLNAQKKFQKPFKLSSFDKFNRVPDSFNQFSNRLNRSPMPNQSSIKPQKRLAPAPKLNHPFRVAPTPPGMKKPVNPKSVQRVVRLLRKIPK